MNELDGERIVVPKFLDGGDGIYAKALTWTGSPIDWINYIAYSNSEHKYMFDEDNLVAHLNMVGFFRTSLREFNDSLDVRGRKNESIYAHAVKPF